MHPEEEVHVHSLHGTHLSTIEEFLFVILTTRSSEWYFNHLLWVGLAGWLGTWFVWLTKGFSYEFYSKAFFVLSLDLVCLQLFLQFGLHGLSMGMAMAGLQSVFLQLATWRKVDILKKKDFEAGSIFVDVAGPLGQTIMVAACQTTLMAFYMIGLFNMGGQYTLTFWLSGYMVQMAAIFNRGSAGMLGNAFETCLWASVVRNSRRLMWTTKGYDGHNIKPFRIPKSIAFFRGCIAFMINNVFRELMSFSFPIRLMMLPQPYLVVATCVSVAYITKLDDMPSKHYELSVDNEYSSLIMVEDGVIDFGVHPSKNLADPDPLQRRPHDGARECAIM